MATTLQRARAVVSSRSFHRALSQRVTSIFTRANVPSSERLDGRGADREIALRGYEGAASPDRTLQAQAVTLFLTDTLVGA